MKITFLQQGLTFTIGDNNTVPTFSAPIGPNIKQLVRFTQVGADTSLSVYVVTDVNGTTESGHTVSLKNIYDGMIFDLSSLAPLTGKDVVLRTNGSTLRDGVRVSVTVRFTTPTGKAFSVYVYPCGSLRLGNTGAANTFSEFNYARTGLNPELRDGHMVSRVEGTMAVAGFYDGIPFAGTGLNPGGSDLGMLTTNAIVGIFIAKFDKATVSVYLRNTSPAGYIRVAAYGGNLYEDIRAGETRRVELPLRDTGDLVPIFFLRSYDTVSVSFVATRMALNVGGCAAPYSLGDTDKTARGSASYMGYLTDYRDGYFNALTREETGQRSGGDFLDAGNGVSATGATFLNSVYYPSYEGAAMQLYLIDKVGWLGTRISTNYLSGYRPTPEEYFQRDKAYIWGGDPSKITLYGVERYKKKLYYDEPLEKKIILRWLNSRGAWDSMYFVNFKMAPQINSTGTVDSFDFNVSVVIDWDNEEALYYLTRSPYIMALTPSDVGQWGWATSESNGVFALQGGNIGKTLNLKFNYKINQA